MNQVVTHRMSVRMHMNCALLAGALAVGSCDATNGTAGPSPPIDVPDTPDTLSVEVGTGVAAFEPLVDGGEVELVFGPQGGFHVWTGVRLRGADFTEGYVNLQAAHQGGTLAGLPSSEAVQFIAAASESKDAAGLRTFVTHKLASGTELTLRTEVVSRDGRHGAAERRVVVR